MIIKSDAKLISALSQKKYRKLHQLFVIEGERIVFEAVKSNINIKQLFITDEFIAKSAHNSIMDLIAENSIITNTIENKEMKDISATISPSGILALCEIPEPQNIVFSKSGNWLFLDEIQNPGNLGTLLRTAAWFDVNNIALSKNCIDAYNPKVVRGGMGAHFNLSIHQNILLNVFKDTEHTIIGAVQSGKDIHKINKKQLNSWVLVISNEAHGISENNIENIDLKVAIPQIGYGESLNAAVAGSILLFQLTHDK